MPKARLLGGQITDIHFSLGHSGERSVGKATVSLDTFNNSSTPPPMVGETASVSFSPGWCAGAPLTTHMI
jgi:putative spermidine/putrescine transport system ATP-binding protein